MIMIIIIIVRLVNDCCIEEAYVFQSVHLKEGFFRV